MSVYCCSDLHGSKELWSQIKNFLKPDDKLYFLGDALDRGEHGIQIAKEMLADERVIYLKGNHEEMFVESMKDYLSDEFQPGEYFYRWVANGGSPTFDEAIKIGVKLDFINQLEKLPSFAYYKNKDGIISLLSHSGFTPRYVDNKLIFPEYEKDYIWDRGHFEKWDEVEELDSLLVIHGHTPIPYMKKYILGISGETEGAYWYCNNHKINLDTGCFWSKKTVLLDLDTFDEHIFETP